MGAGPRFQWGVFFGLGFGVRFDSFPYDYTIYIQVLCFSFFIGLGQPYDARSD